MIDFHPKFIDAMKNYSREKFAADVMAGIIVGIVAIPLAIAFGIASGVGPAEGLVTAIIAGVLISLLGGSKVQIGGPTGAFIVIIYGIIQQYGLGGLAIATIMAGIILVIMGLLPTRLQKRRKDAGLTQKELAGRSGVKLRTIQQYEMRAKNINKAAAETLLQFAQVLYCSIEDLLEYD